MIKPVIGDDHREVDNQDILRTNHLMLLGVVFVFNGSFSN